MNVAHQIATDARWICYMQMKDEKEKAIHALLIKKNFFSKLARGGLKNIYGENKGCNKLINIGLLNISIYLSIYLSLSLYLTIYCIYNFYILISLMRGGEVKVMQVIQLVLAQEAIRDLKHDVMQCYICGEWHHKEEQTV